MRDHVRILAILHIVFSCLGVVAAMIVLLVFGGLAGAVGLNPNATDDRATPVAVLGILGVGICVIILVLAVPGLIAGIGLLKLRPWSRILTIVLSALDLLSVPFGTALGIYGLWVLLSPPTEELFREQRPNY